jgi:hypothetical protein
MNKHLRIIGLSNDLPEIGKPLIIPFGSFLHKTAKLLQMVNAQTVLMMVNEFKVMAAKPGFKGLPVYIGHPDVPGFEKKYPDHRSYAWIIDMIANEDLQQLELYPDWTKPGADLLTNEHFAYFSPNWLAVKGKPGEALPFKILSVGLTNTPMIEYLALACEDSGEDTPITITEGNTMNLLQRLLALLPENVSKNITDEDGIVSFFQKMIDGFKALRDSQKDRWKAEDAAYMALENENLAEGFGQYLQLLADQAVALANEVPAATAATLSQVQDELTLANESLTALRGAHSKLLLDQALAAGKITPATRTKWEDRFADPQVDCLSLANELNAIDPVMKTTSVTKGAKPTDHGGATHEDLIALANEMCEGNKNSFESAYARAKKAPQFAHLFQVKQADAQ